MLSRRDTPRRQVVCTDAMDFRQVGISEEIGGGRSSVLQGFEELHRAKSSFCGDIHLNRLCRTQVSASASSRSGVEDRRDFRIDCRGSDQDHVRRGCNLSRFRYPCMNLQQSLVMPDWLGNHTLDQEVAHLMKPSNPVGCLNIPKIKKLHCSMIGRSLGDCPKIKRTRQDGTASRKKSP
jgi:hypothetical protein